MASNKRVPKTEPKQNIELNEEQKRAKGGVFTHDVSIFLGEFGSGKTQTAVSTALSLYHKNIVDKIYITRPIDFEATGYLSGSASEKMYFHTLPMKLNFYSAFRKEEIDKYFNENIIEIVPIDYMKGMTFLRAVTIVDEFEDISYDEFKLILTRLGKDSKIIFTGSEEQIDVKNSCIPKVKYLEDCPFVNFHTLKSQHRNDSIQKILDYIKDKDDNKRTSTLDNNGVLQNQSVNRASNISDVPLL